MSATVLPELAAESVELAERLVRLSAEEGLDPAEAGYILACGLAAIQRVPGLWPIIRGRIAGGTTGATAHLLLTRLLDAVNRNLFLAGMLKKLAQAVREEMRREQRPCNEGGIRNECRPPSGSAPPEALHAAA